MKKFIRNGLILAVCTGSFGAYTYCTGYTNGYHKGYTAGSKLVPRHVEEGAPHTTSHTKKENDLVLTKLQRDNIDALITYFEAYKNENYR